MTYENGQIWFRMNQNGWQWCKTFQNGGTCLKLLKTVQYCVIWPKMLQHFDWEIVQKVVKFSSQWLKMNKNDSKWLKTLKCLKRLNVIKILGLKAKKMGGKIISPPKKSRKLKKILECF